jgi:hypothetical protein
VFLTVPKPDGETYEQYRELRSSVLLTYCHGLKLKFPWVVEAVGVASEPMSESVSSQDFLYVDLGDEKSETEEGAKWQEAMVELDVLQSRTVKLLRGQDHERGLPSVGEADRAEWLAIQDFQHRVSDMLAWVADTLMPQGTELHTKGIDAAIDLLQQRLLTLGSSG